MDGKTLMQARALYKTIQDVKARVLIRNAPNNVGLECGAKELTLPQMSTLLVVRDSGAMSVKELAEATNVSPPSASAMVDRLVELGILTRKPSEVDRREVRIALSEDGEKAVHSMEEQIFQSIIEIMEKIGPEYTEMWSKVYARIQEVLDEEKAERGRQSGPPRNRSSAAV